MRSKVVLPAPFNPRITTREPLSIAKSTSVKISSEPYDLLRPVAEIGVFPHGEGVGKRNLATRSLLRSSSRFESNFSARRNIPCAALAFVAFARIFSACFSRMAAFFSALARSLFRRCSSCSLCCKYFFQPML